MDTRRPQNEISNGLTKADKIRARACGRAAARHERQGLSRNPAEQFSLPLEYQKPPWWTHGLTRRIANCKANERRRRQLPFNMKMWQFISCPLHPGAGVFRT
jgi:hypothetical protein